MTPATESPVAQVLDSMISGDLIYLLSPALLSEYRGVLLRPGISARHRLPEVEVDDLLVNLTANAMWREPGDEARAPDPGDDHPWSLLQAHSGSILITGDRLLLEAPPAESSVISARTWLDRFAKSR